VVASVHSLELVNATYLEVRDGHHNRLTPLLEAPANDDNVIRLHGDHYDRSGRRGGCWVDIDRVSD
jgi:hypothetical protein